MKQEGEKQEKIHSMKLALHSFQNRALTQQKEKIIGKLH
jgi:hypothetical protein